MVKVYFKLFMCVIFASFLVSILMSEPTPDLSDLFQDFQFVFIAVFTAIVWLLFFIRKEAGELISNRFNEPKLKNNFPKVITYLVLLTLFLQILGAINVL